MAEDCLSTDVIIIIPCTLNRQPFWTTVIFTEWGCRILLGTEKRLTLWMRVNIKPLFTSEPHQDLLTRPKGEGLAVLPAMSSDCAAISRQSEYVPNTKASFWSDNPVTWVCQSDLSCHFSQKSFEEIFFCGEKNCLSNYNSCKSNFKVDHRTFAKVSSLKEPT